MKYIDTIKRATKNLRQAKGRTILTSLAIAVGAFTITLAMGAGAGGRAYVNDMANQSGDARALNVYAKYEQAATSAEQQPLQEYGVMQTQEASRNNLKDSDIQYLQDIEGVESATANFDVNVTYVTRGEGEKKFSAPVRVRNDKTDMKLIAGSLQDGAIIKGGLVVPGSYLKQLGFSDAQQAIGKTLSFKVPLTSPGSDMAIDETRGLDETLTIVAVDAPGDTNVYYSAAFSISSTDGERFYNYQHGSLVNPEYYGAVVRVAPGFDLKAVQQTVNEKYNSYSLEQQREQLLQAVTIAQWALIGFGALAILASIFGIINTQYISVLERTQQIGLMKALGMRSKDVRRLFLIEAALVGLLGGVLGAGLAALTALFNPLISGSLGLKDVTLLIFEPLPIIVLIVSLMIIAILSGYFPSRKAAKLNPIEALRTE